MGKTSVRHNKRDGYSGERDSWKRSDKRAVHQRLRNAAHDPNALEDDNFFEDLPGTRKRRVRKTEDD